MITIKEGDIVVENWELSFIEGITIFSTITKWNGKEGTWRPLVREDNAGRYTAFNLTSSDWEIRIREKTYEQFDGISWRPIKDFRKATAKESATITAEEI